MEAYSHAKCQSLFKYAMTKMSTARTEMETARDFVCGHQFTDAEKKVLNERGQAATETNLMAPAINGIIGMISSNDTDPRVYPRQPGSEDAADVATKLLRYVADESGFDDIKVEASDSFFVEGIAATYVTAKAVRGRGLEEQDVEIGCHHIRPEEFFVDPASKRHDFTDASFIGKAVWMDADKVSASYPELEEAVKEYIKTSASGSVDGIMGTGDNDNEMWYDSERRRFMMVDMYYWIIGPDGNRLWLHTLFCSVGEVLHEVSKYKDDRDRTYCPIVAISYGRDRDNSRFGLARAMIPHQRSYNTAFSRSVHSINSRQTRRTAEMTADPMGVEQLRKEAGKVDAVIPYGYELVPNNDIANGCQLIMSTAAEYINRLAPSAAALARGNNNASGRKTQIDQMAGMTELSPYLLRLTWLECEMYKRFWWMAQQWWTDPKIITIVGSEDAVNHMTINEPIVEQQMVPYTHQVPGPDGQPVEQPYLGADGMPMTYPKAVVVGYRNQLAEMDVNIDIKSTPNSINLQNEAHQELMGLFQAGVGIDDPRLDVAIETSLMPDKSRIKDLIKTKREEIQQASAAQQQAAMQAAAQEAQTKTIKAQSDAEKNQASAFKHQQEGQRIQLENEVQKTILGMSQPLPPM